MSTEITNEEPVLVLNDKKYIISEMTDLQKAFVVELNALEQEESKSDKQDETSQNNPVDEGENKSDELMQAEAILNALKDQEKINQKQKILKTKSLKFDKDW